MNKNGIKRWKQGRIYANRLLRERPELAMIKENGVKIAFLTSEQEKLTGHGQKGVLGECVKVPDNYQWICPYDFLIICYKHNCFAFTDEQFKILVWHELLHIGVDNDGIEPTFYIRKHDYEEFEEIERQYGLRWSRNKVV